MERAIFLDRDGTINKYGEYIYRPQDFVFIDGAIEFIKKFNDARYKIFVVSNQAGIGRGYYSEKDLFALQKWVDDELAKSGAHIDDWFYCPHHPTAGIGEYKIDCSCRKPKTGMLEKAIRLYDVDIVNSFMIGDKEWDVQCGERLGIKSFLLENEDYANLESQIAEYVEFRKKGIDVSFIVVNENSFTELEYFSRIISEKINYNYELIIVDKCSGDIELEKIRKTHPMDRLLAFTEKYDEEDMEIVAAKYSDAKYISFVGNIKKATKMLENNGLHVAYSIDSSEKYTGTKLSITEIVKDKKNPLINVKRVQCDFSSADGWAMKNGQIVKTKKR